MKGGLTVFVVVFLLKLRIKSVKYALENERQSAHRNNGLAKIRHIFKGNELFVQRNVNVVAGMALTRLQSDMGQYLSTYIVTTSSSASSAFNQTGCHSF